MPFHDLVLEVVCEIFLQANNVTLARLPDPRSMPVVVSSVCKGWRNAAIHYRSLWTSYQIEGSSLVRNGSLFLARAGHLPVYATILVGPPPSRLVYDMFSAHKVSYACLAHTCCSFRFRALHTSVLIASIGSTAPLMRMSRSMKRPSVQRLPEFWHGGMTHGSTHLLRGTLAWVTLRFSR